MKETDFLIKVEELSKSYPTGFWRRRIRVLTDLSFTVARNEIVGFLGPNGAGKTTTIKILNRLAFPDSGTVTVFGEEAGRRPELRRRIGFMPEQPYFYEYLTGEEFLGLCGHLNGLTRAEIAKGSRRMLSRVGLEGAGGTAIRKYSKGMMQRLGLPQALLLDVEALCDRVIILLKARKVAEGRVEELVGREGIRYVELLFSPVPDDGSLSRLGVPPEGATVRGNAFVLRAKDFDEANRWIERFREAGSLLRSCIPVKKQLEDIYVEQVAGRERVDAPASDPESPGSG